MAELLGDRPRTVLETDKSEPSVAIIYSWPEKVRSVKSVAFCGCDYSIVSVARTAHYYGI
jgi:hypothetical protein